MLKAMRRAIYLLVLAFCLIHCGDSGISNSTLDAGASIDSAPAVAPDANSEPSPSEAFYDPSTIVEVRLTASPADITTLDNNPFADVYVPATFTWQGQEVANVGLRYKGNSSLARAGEKPSLKIKFNEFSQAQRFLGLTKVNFNNSVLDPSMQRETTAYGLFRDFGVPAPRANYAKVYLNGQYSGLYVNVEQVDKRALTRLFGDNSGNLYKQYSGASLEYRGASPAAYDDGTYRKKTNEIEDDWGDLIALTQLLDSGDSTTIEAELPQILDVSLYLRWLAVNTYLSHIDAYTGFANNYYLYRNPTTMKFVYIPWDLDITFGTQGHANTTDSFLLTWDLFDPQIPSPTGPRPMLTKLMAIASFRTEYTGYLVELVDGGQIESRILSQLDEVRARITDAATTDTSKPYTNSEFLSSLVSGVPAPGDTLPVIGIRNFVEQRTANVLSQLP